jgi:hypothetical protein
MHFPQLIIVAAGDQLTTSGLSTGREGGQVTSRSGLGGLGYDVRLCGHFREKKKERVRGCGATPMWSLHTHLDTM